MQVKWSGTQTTRPRPTHAVKIAAAANKEFRYIASVDEMKDFLDDTFREGIEIWKACTDDPRRPRCCRILKDARACRFTRAPQSENGLETRSRCKGL